MNIAKTLILLTFFLSQSAFADTHEAKLKELESKIQILTNEVQGMRSGSRGFDSKLSIGGYGEIVYKNIRSEDESNTKTATGTNPQVDTLRNVIYLGYKFSEKWVFTTEIEIEHADEIFAEVATIDYRANDLFNWRSGLMLIPVGLVNEYHEPTTFYAVNRSEVESKIIPTTWRANGTGFYGKNDWFAYKFLLVNGLGVGSSGSTIDGSSLRKGRKKGSQAEARDLAWVGRFDFSPLSNLTLGTSLYIGKVGGIIADVDLRMYDFHLDTRYKGLHFRALYVYTEVDNVTNLSNELGLASGNHVGKVLQGHYFELGYNVLRNFSNAQLIPHIRFEQYNTQEKIAAGQSADPENDVTNITYGLNYKPLSQIVFKADYMKKSNAAKTGVDQWNLGMGWNF
ncbi:MAG: hypothetical protein ACPGJV_10745 [Bacteriovoracaceae bacterium]